MRLAVFCLLAVFVASSSTVRAQTVTTFEGIDASQVAHPEADADANVSVVGGALEGSNVNVVDAMVSMINLGRQFEMQMNLLKNAESNASKASQILSMS